MSCRNIELDPAGMEVIRFYARYVEPQWHARFLSNVSDALLANQLSCDESTVADVCMSVLIAMRLSDETCCCDQSRPH